MLIFHTQAPIKPRAHARHNSHGYQHVLGGIWRLENLQRQGICAEAVRDDGLGPSSSSSTTSRTPKALVDMSMTTRRTVLKGMIAGMAIASCSCCQQLGVSPANASEVAGPHWDYELGGQEGPDLWPGVCRTSKQQSPVNLAVAEATAPGAPETLTCKLGDVSFKYGNQESVVVLNTGHGTPQVNFEPGNTAKVGDMELELLQYHFHTPSEHAFDGKRWPMEVHLVHRNKATGSLAVVGVMINNGATFPNPALQTALVYAGEPKVMQRAPVSVNPMNLLPADDGKGHRPYIHYAGSLTTPPCSEGVDWFVLTSPIKVTDRQVISFMTFVGKGMTLGLNARPLQPLEGRALEYDFPL